MNKYQKLLKKVSPEDRKHITEAVKLIVLGNLSSLHIKKLSGVKNLYRARIGSFRVIFRAHKNYHEILDITRRDDNTYAGL